MLITPSLLSIPPYISAAWKNIASLHLDMQSSRTALVVTLTQGAVIYVPHLDPASIEAVFAAHAKYSGTEQENHLTKLPLKKPNCSDAFAASFSFPLETPLNMNVMGAVLQHNPEQANTPDLPAELIGKIISLSKTIGISDPDMIPLPEPDCNCIHCQITKALQLGFEAQATEQDPAREEEVVTEEDLRFRTWDINQTDEKLFVVQNPLDDKEHYSVYLGEPIGCTCGQKSCEHIRAVLSS